MSYADNIIKLIEDEFYIALNYTIHASIRSITASEYMELLDNLIKYITDEDDDDCERYISKRHTAYCVLNILFTELKYSIYIGKYSVAEDYINVFADDLTFYTDDPDADVPKVNAGKISIARLRQIVREINATDEDKSYLDFSKDIDEIENLDFSKCKMHFELLESLMNTDTSTLVMHMLYFLHPYSSEEELKPLDKFVISEYNDVALKKAISMTNSSIFCHCFLGVASDYESRAMYEEIQNMEEVFDPWEIIFNIANQDVWLARWVNKNPLLPYTTYKILTDEAFEVKLFDFEEYDESNVVSAFDITLEDIAPHLEKALAGDPDAQHRLAEEYLRLKSTSVNLKKAKYWARKPAEAGIPKSQFLYATIIDREDDDEEAFQWFLKAAEGGIAEAQFRVGVAYADGLGVKQSRDEAIKWLTLAVDQNHFLAKFRLDLLIKQS